MQRIEKFEEFERTIAQVDPDLGQHVAAAVLAIVAGIGVLALIVTGMTAHVPFVVPVL